MTTEIVKTDGAASVEIATLFGTNDPESITKKAVAIAEQVGGVIEAKGLAQRISNRSYIRAEGWQMLGGLMGLTAVTDWTKPIPPNWDGKGRPYGWEARCEIRTLDGRIVGVGEASCMRDESNWADRDDYALRSMAQTRALGKAYRLAVGYIATLAGYEATPAEEMSGTVNAPAQTSRGSQGESGGSQDLSCPACGSKVYDNRAKIASGEFSDKSPRYACSNKKGESPCTGANADGEIVTDGDAGKPWVTWHEHYFDPKPSSAGLDTVELREVKGHVETKAITESAVLSIARRIAKANSEDQPTSLDEIGALSSGSQAAIAEAVAEKVVSE